MSSKTAAICALLIGAFAAAAVEPPVVPVGLDAYRQWSNWPCQRIGVRAYLRSTYDRRGGNEGADASHFLYHLRETNNEKMQMFRLLPAAVRFAEPA